MSLHGDISVKKGVEKWGAISLTAEKVILDLIRYNNWIVNSLGFIVRNIGVSEFECCGCHSLIQTHQ